MNSIVKSFLILIVFTLIVLGFHFLLSLISSDLNLKQFSLICLFQFLLSSGVFVLSIAIQKKQSDNLGYFFLITSTLKTIVLYLVISYFLFPDITLSDQNKLLLCFNFLLFLGLDVYLTARLLNSKPVN